MITQKQELIEDLKAQDMQQQFIYEQMARFVEQLPPQIQQTISQMPEDELMQLMMLPPNEQMEAIQYMTMPQAQ